MAVTHVARNPEIVIMSDRDGFGFVHDRVPEDVPAMTAGTYSVANTPVKNERCLQWYPISAAGGGGAPRCAFYLDGGAAYALKEVISPRLNFDRTSNMLYMTFWTNFTEDPAGVYDPTKVRIIDEDNFDSDQTNIMALCNCAGMFQYMSVSGGDIASGQAGPPPGSNYDGPTPVFYKPIILQTRVIPDVSGVSVVDIGGVGGGLPTFKFRNTDGLNAPKYAALIPDASFPGGMTNDDSDPPKQILALRFPNAGEDAWPMVYICTTTGGVDTGAIGTVAHPCGAMWVQVSGTPVVGYVCGTSVGGTYLRVDIPGGFRIAAHNSDTGLTLVMPDHRPVMLVGQGNSTSREVTYRVRRDATTIGTVDGKANSLPGYPP